MVKLFRQRCPEKGGYDKRGINQKGIVSKFRGRQHTKLTTTYLQLFPTVPGQYRVPVETFDLAFVQRIKKFRDTS